MTNMQPTAQMECISRLYVEEHLDEILERIDKEDIGFVITDQNHKDLVICHAKWFSYCFDNDFGCVIVSAVRYVLGRETYMPSVISDFVVKYMKVLDENTIEVIMRDIERFLDTCEQPVQENTWVSLLKKFVQEKQNFTTDYGTTSKERGLNG